jgi:hypothetical protein
MYNYYLNEKTNPKERQFIIKLMLLNLVSVIPLIDSEFFLWCN